MSNKDSPNEQKMTSRTMRLADGKAQRICTQLQDDEDEVCKISYCIIHFPS